ncbi:MAG: hypothetical protein AAF311_13725 [Pseudomonadota bacterium]
MTPTLIAWIVAVTTGATGGKLLGTFLRSRSFGLIGNPVISLLGGLAIWQGAVLAGMASPEDYIFAGILSLIGGIAVLILASRLRRG